MKMLHRAAVLAAYAGIWMGLGRWIDGELPRPESTPGKPPAFDTSSGIATSHLMFRGFPRFLYLGVKFPEGDELVNEIFENR